MIQSHEIFLHTEHIIVLLYDVYSCTIKLLMFRSDVLFSRSFKKSVSDVILSRQAIANLNRYNNVMCIEMCDVQNIVT